MADAAVDDRSRDAAAAGAADADGADSNGASAAGAGGGAPNGPDDLADDFDELPLDADDEPAERRNGGAGNGGTGSGTAGQTAGGGVRSARTARALKSPLQHVSIAMPLLLHVGTAASLLRQSAINELLRATVRDGTAAAATGRDKAAATASPKQKETAPHSMLCCAIDEQPVRLPYHLEAINNSSCGRCLQQALLPSHAHAAQLQPAPLYTLDWSLKHQALLSFAQVQWSRAEDGRPQQPVQAQPESSVLTQLLLQYLGGQSPVAPPAPAAAAAAATTCDPRFLAILHRGLVDASPLSLDLAGGEAPFYAAVSRMGVEALRLVQQSPAAGNALLSSAGISALELQETMLRYWLGRGGTQQCMDAVSFLLRQQSGVAGERLRLRSFMRQWASLMRASSRTVLRVSRSKHLSQVAANARTTKLVCSAVPSSRSALTGGSGGSGKRGAAAKEQLPSRRWDYEDDSGWARYDERVCQLLEEAYQAGRPSVEFTLDPAAFAVAAAAASGSPPPGPVSYRADLVKMTQKNLSSGRERPLRCLLALLIKEKGGRIAQTVEINMPHDTPIRDLRAELANYLRHDEKLLRMTYGHRVLRRADFESATIRSGIVPLGAEALTVTKLAKGDYEDLCTWVSTGPRAVKQPLFECGTCDLRGESGCFVCAVCAAQCHRGHETRRVSEEELAQCGLQGGAGFCCCGAGAGGDQSPCRSLEEQPDAQEAYHGPHMALSPCGAWLFLLSSEHGLVKLGTGTGGGDVSGEPGAEGDSVTGKLYMQNTCMSAHAGGQLVCVWESSPAASKSGPRKSVLLLRSPVLGPGVLLHVDPDTLLFTGQRTLLPQADPATTASLAPGAAAPATLALELPPQSCVAAGAAAAAGAGAGQSSNSWQLEWKTHDPSASDSDDVAASPKDAAAAAAAAAASPPLDEHGTPLPSWAPLSPDLVSQAKQVLCTNWCYGTILHGGGVPDPSCPSLALEEEGMALRVPVKMGVRRARVRVKHAECVQQLFYLPDTHQLQVLNLVPLGPAPAPVPVSASASATAAPTAGAGAARPARRREHGLALDLYQLPDEFAAPPTLYCRRCAQRLPGEGHAPGAASTHCPCCDAPAPAPPLPASPGALGEEEQGQEQKRESESASAGASARKGSDAAPSLPPSLPASPTGQQSFASPAAAAAAAAAAAGASASALSGASGSAASSSSSSSSSSSEENEVEEKLYMLSLLGVSRARAVAALQGAGGDLDAASNALLAEMERAQSAESSPGASPEVSDGDELSDAEAELRRALGEDVFVEEEEEEEQAPQLQAKGEPAAPALSPFYSPSPSPSASPPSAVTTASSSSAAVSAATALAHTLPVGEAFYAHALLAAGAGAGTGAVATGASSLQALSLRFHRAELLKRVRLDAVVDTWNKEARIRSAMAATAAAAGSGAGSAAGVAAPKTFLCDGCGGSGAPIALCDPATGAAEPASASSSLSALSLCTDRACASGGVGNGFAEAAQLCLCKWCALMGHWRSATHRPEHAMQRIHPHELGAAVPIPGSAAAAAAPATRFTLGEYACYLDARRGVLVLLRDGRDLLSPVASGPTPASGSSTHVECCTLFCPASGRLLSRAQALPTRGDCFATVPVPADWGQGEASAAQVVWAYSGAGARLERWECPDDDAVAPGDDDASAAAGDAAEAESGIGAVEAATLILRHLPCLSSCPRAIASGLAQLLQLLIGTATASVQGQEAQAQAQAQHQTLVATLLFQVRAHLRAWNLRSSAGGASASTPPEAAASFAGSVAHLRAVMSLALGLGGGGGEREEDRRNVRSMLRRREAAPSRPGQAASPHRTLFPTPSPAPEASTSSSTPPLPVEPEPVPLLSLPTAVLVQGACDAVVEGFELLYPSWKERAALLERLLDAVSLGQAQAQQGAGSGTAQGVGPGLGGAAGPISCALALLQALSERYRAAYMGLINLGSGPSLSPPASASPAAAGAGGGENVFPSLSPRDDPSLLSPYVQNLVHTWVELVYEHELDGLDCAQQPQPQQRKPHALAFVLLAYQSQLTQLVLMQNLSGSSGAGSCVVPPRSVRSATAALLKLATVLFEHVVELSAATERALRREQQRKHREQLSDPLAEKSWAAVLDAELAEETLAHVSDSPLGAMLQFALLAVSELQVEQLALTGAASAALIAQFLRQSLALLCALGGLQSRALAVSFVAQSGSLAAGRLTRAQTRVRLGNTRQKIAALRQSGQLLTLHSLDSTVAAAVAQANSAASAAAPAGSAASAPSASSVSPSNKRSSSKSSAPALPYALTPAAVEVFTDLFLEFCAGRGGGGGGYAAVVAPPGAPFSWSFGRAALLRSDLACLYRKRGAHTQEVAFQKAQAAFAKYGMRAANTEETPAAAAYRAATLGTGLQGSAPQPTQSLLGEGDESSALSLPSFLQLMTDSCVESSRRVLRDLRLLELRHHFLCTRHPGLLLVQDARVGVAHVLHRLFTMPAVQGRQQRHAALLGSVGAGPLPLSRSLVATATAAAASGGAGAGPPLSYAQALHSRSIEELVNIPPGSTEMSPSLRAAAAAEAAQRQASLARTAETDGAAGAAIGPDVLMRLLSSQESWKSGGGGGGGGARAKLFFLSQFIRTPLFAPPPQHLPASSPVAALTPRLRHEVAAEELASSLVGESNAVKHAAAHIGWVAGHSAAAAAGSPGASSAGIAAAGVAEEFSDAAASERLSRLFQHCMREVAPTLGAFAIYPEPGSTDAEQPTKSLLAMLGGSGSGSGSGGSGGSGTPVGGGIVPPGVVASLPASSALFLVEKLFACALVKHNGLTEELLSYARSLELYRLLASKQTKNVRLLTQPATPEWLRRVVRATARFVRQPVLDLLRKHREAQQEELARKEEAAAAAAARAKGKSAASAGGHHPSGSISDASASSGTGALLERKEDLEAVATPPSAPPSAPATPHAHARRPSLNVQPREEEEETYPSVALFQQLDRWSANCEFLLGGDLRGMLLQQQQQQPVGAPKPGSLQSSPVRGAHRLQTLSSQVSPRGLGTPTREKSDQHELKTADSAAAPAGAGSELLFSSFASSRNNRGGAGQGEDEADEDESDEEDFLRGHSEQDEGATLLLRRVQSDLFSSPMRGEYGAGAQVSSLDLGAGAAAAGPSSGGARALHVSAGPFATTPTAARRLSDSDLQLQQLLQSGGIGAGAGGGASGVEDAPDMPALSRWTSTTVRPPPASLASAGGEDEESAASLAATQRAFEAEWLARLMASEQRLSESIGSSVRFLTSSAANRIKLLQLVNAAFQHAASASASSGRAHSLVDEVLPLLWQAGIVREVHAAHALRASNQGDALLFFYKHLSQTLSQLALEPEDDSPALMGPLSLSLPLAPGAGAGAGAGASPSVDAAAPGSSRRAHVRVLYARIRTILRFLSLEADPADSDIILGSGMLSVLPRFIARLDHAQAAHQRAMHAHFYAPVAATDDGQQREGRLGASAAEGVRALQKALDRAASSSSSSSVAVPCTTGTGVALVPFSSSPVPMSPAPPRPSPTALDLRLWDDLVRESSTSQRWSWHIFLYLSSFLLGRPPSRHTAQQRYVLASTVGRQLNAMVQDNIQRIQQALVSGFAFAEERHRQGEGQGEGRRVPGSAAPRTGTGRVHASDMSELGVFPLQTGNPLQQGGHALDELVFRTVDMLKLLERVATAPDSVAAASAGQAGRAAQEHSVCSRKHILFFLRVLRMDEVVLAGTADDSEDASFGGGRTAMARDRSARPRVPISLPSIVQLAIIQLLKRELPYHAPVVQASFASQPSSALNSPARKSPAAPTPAPTPASIASSLFTPSFSPPCASPPPLMSASLFQRTPSTLAEDAAFSGVDLAAELVDTVAAMQAQQSIVNLASAKGQGEGAKSQAQAQVQTQTEMKQQQSPQPLQRPAAASSSAIAAPPAPVHSASTALSVLSQPSRALIALSSSDSTSAGGAGGAATAASAKESARQASFRRIAALLCAACSYLEFPACARHRFFLTRMDPGGNAACPVEGCATTTGKGSPWARCLSCKAGRASPCGGGGVQGVQWWLISASEAAYAANAIKSNTAAVIPHNVFTCPTCHVAEFPGTRTGGLTLNKEGRLYDAPTRRYLDASQYHFTHYAPTCAGTMRFTPVRFSKEEAACLGKLVQRTPALDTSLPLEDFGPGKGSTLPRSDAAATDAAAAAATAGAAMSPAAVLASLLGEPQAFESWKPTEQGRACAFMEMVNLMRSFVGSVPAASAAAAGSKDRAAEAGAGAAATAAPQGDSTGAVSLSRAASSVEAIPSSAATSSLRGQWREALLHTLRAAFYDATDAVHEMTETASRLSSSASAAAPSFAHSGPRLLRSMLALQVLGGLPESLHNGSRVEVRVDGSVVVGVVQHYDPMLATVSVAIKRHAADAGGDGSAGGGGGGKDAAGGSGGQRNGGGANVAALISQLGLQSDQQFSGAGVLEFPLSEVTPLSPSPPPSLLAVLGSAADILRQAHALLSIEPVAAPAGAQAKSPRGGAHEERKESLLPVASAADAATAALRLDMLQLLVAQMQQQLLLLLHLHLPQWLVTSPSLSREVLQLLAVSLGRWERSGAARTLPLLPQQWASTARLLSQQLVDKAWQMQDPFFFERRLRIAADAAATAKEKEKEKSAAAKSAGADAGAKAPSAPSNAVRVTTGSGASAGGSGSGRRLSLTRSSFLVSDPMTSSEEEEEEEEEESDEEEGEEEEEEEEQGASASSSAPSPPPPMPPLLQSLDRLAAMGFPAAACRFALASTRGNLEASISVILEAMGVEEEVDEAEALAAFETAIDRLGQRAAVETYRAWQERQQAQMRAQQARAVVDANAPLAPPISAPASSLLSPSGRPGASGAGASAGGAESKPPGSDRKVPSEAERRLLQAGSSIHMASRFGWSDEVPLDALALAAPVDSVAATSRALNSGTAARAIDWVAEQDRALLLHRAQSGTLLGAELLIPPEAAESLHRLCGGHSPRGGTGGPGASPRYRIGDTLTIIDLVNKVCPAVVDDLSEDGSKIYVHYIGWSKKWDEWVAVNSPRILPKFHVGERLVVKDSVNKDSEAAVVEVAIRDNALKILIHYVGWSQKWDEWLPANSPRIVARKGDKGDKHGPGGEGGPGAALAALQAALGLSPADSMRLAPAPFALDNRTGEVVAVNLNPPPSLAGGNGGGGSSGGGSGAGGSAASSSGAASEADSGPMVLLRVVDETQLHCTLLVWVRLSLLRSSSPRAHQSPSHLCPLPAAPASFNSATLAALQLDTPALVSLAVDAQRNACADLARRIVQESIARLTHAQSSKQSTDQAAAAGGVTSPQSASALSPMSPLTPILAQAPADMTQSLPQLLQRFRLAQLLPLISRQTQAQQTSLLSFAHSDFAAASPPSVGAAAAQSSSSPENERSKLVATVAQLVLARWQMDVLGMESSSSGIGGGGHDDSDSEEPNRSSIFSSFESEMHELIEAGSEALAHATHALATHKLTTVLQGQAQTVAVEYKHPSERRARACVPLEEQEEEDASEPHEAATAAAAGEEEPVPFQLQLVSMVLPSPDRSGEAPLRFTKESVWSVSFYADASRTVLLRQVHLSGDQASRHVAPFLVTNPVYIESSLSARTRAKLGENKPAAAAAAAGGSGKKRPTGSLSDDHATFSITPFQHQSLEALLLLTEALVHVRRSQVAAQWSAQHEQPANAGAGAAPSSSSAFSFSPLAGLASSSSSASASSAGNLLATVVRSTSLARLCTSFLEMLFASLRDFASHLQRALPLPSNLRVRVMEGMTLLLQTHLLSCKAQRDQHGLPLKDADADADVGTDEAGAHDSDDESLGLSASSSQRAAAEMDLTWLGEAVLPEAKARYAAEKTGAPIFSVYLQRSLELLLVGVRYERMQAEHAAVDSGLGAMGEMPLRRLVRSELPLVLAMEQLLLHASHPAAHPPPEDNGVDVEECSCPWCEQLSERKDEAQQAALVMDMGPSSVLATMLADEDHFPTLRPAQLLRSPMVPPARNDAATAPTLPDLSEPDETESPQAAFAAAAAAAQASRSGGASSSISNMLSSFNQRLFRRLANEPNPLDLSAAAEVLGMSPPPAAAASSSSSSSSLSSTSAALASITSETRSAQVAALKWRSQVSLCDRLLSSASLRARLLNLLLNGTSAPALPRPEIAFKRRGAELDEMTSVTASKHIYRNKAHTHPNGGSASGSAGAALSAKDKQGGAASAALDEDGLGRSQMFQQLVDAFLKGGLHCKPIVLRAELGAVTFKCILSGVLDAGAAGLPGPFRQALTEISAALSTGDEESMSSSGSSSSGYSATPPLLIPSPNSRSQTGDDRNKLVLNPSLLSQGEIALVQARIFGQLLGIAIRSKCCLNLDLAAVVWKGLLELPLLPEDLASFDYTASRSLRFVDPATDAPFTPEEFDEYMEYLTWTTVLSDGSSMVELRPGGSRLRVEYAQRHAYAAKAVEARLHESALLVASIREGLLSIISKQCLHLLTWRELELRVCGRPTVDLAVLERHTVYSGGYTRASGIIENFWTVLRDFTPAELASFLQFAWARSRLPADEAGQGSYRMQLNILDASASGKNSQSSQSSSDRNDMLLPTSETCFFNVNMPKYSNLETMRSKIKMALLCSTITS